MIKIQLVDDEPNILTSLQRLLRSYPLEVHAFSDVREALQALTEHEYAVIISDYKMPSLDGITYLQFVKQRQPDAVRMVISGHGDRQAMMAAINRAEIFRFLSKPWEEHEVKTALKAAIDLHQQRISKQHNKVQDRILGMHEAAKSSLSEDDSNESGHG